MTYNDENARYFDQFKIYFKPVPINCDLWTCQVKPINLYLFWQRFYVKSRWVDLICKRRFSVVVGRLEKEQLGNLVIFLSVIIHANVLSTAKSHWKVGFHFTLLQTCMEFGVVASFLIAILAFSSTTIFFFLLRYFSEPKYHIHKCRVLTIPLA